MALGDVVDQLLDDHGLAHPRAAEQPDLPALHEGGDQVHYLDARLENLRLGLEMHEIRALAVYRPALDARRNRRSVVDRLADHVEYSPQRGLAHRHGNGLPGVHDLQAANDTVGGRHGHGPHLVATDVLLHFGHHPDRVATVRGPGYLERVVKLGQVPGVELDVEHGTDDLDDFADRYSHMILAGCLLLPAGAAAACWCWIWLLVAGSCCCLLVLVLVLVLVLDP